MEKAKIPVLHVILLSMTVIGLKNHVTIIPSIIQEGGRDGWLSILLGTIFTFPWLFMILYFYKKLEGQSVREWLLQSMGKVCGNIIIYLIAFYCLLLAAFSIRESLQWMHTTFLATTPLIVLLTIYMVLITFLVTTNIQTIAIVNIIVLFAVLVLGFFVAFVNIQVKDYTLVLPFLEHGITPVVKATVYPMSGFIELFPLLFIQHQVKGQIKWWHLVLMLVFLTGLTMGPFLGAIAEFGPDEAARQMYPAYEEWGLASIGRFIEHMDFFSIYQWMTGTFIRVGFIMFVGVQLLGLEGKQQDILRFVAPALFFSAAALFLIPDAFFIRIKGHSFLISTIIIFLTMSLLFTIVAWWKDKNRAKSGE